MSFHALFYLIFHLHNMLYLQTLLNLIQCFIVVEELRESPVFRACHDCDCVFVRLLHRVLPFGVDDQEVRRLLRKLLPNVTFALQLLIFPSLTSSCFLETVATIHLRDEDK
jgi:hypothetical protein